MDIAERTSLGYFRAMIYNNYRQPSVHSFQQCCQLKVCEAASGTRSASRSTVHNRYNKFQFARTMSEDSDCCGCPVTVTHTNTEELYVTAVAVL